MNDRQTRRTDKLQMMTSHQSHTSQSHKRIAQTKSHEICRRHIQEWNDKTTLGTLQSNSGAYGVPETGESNRNMSKSKGWTLQSSLLTLWMEKTQVNNQTKIDDNVNLLKTL